MFDTSYRNSTTADARSELGQQLTLLEDAVRAEYNRVVNDPLQRVLRTIQSARRRGVS